MPNSPIFPQLFGRSPIAPIQQHMKIAAEAANELVGFVDAAIAGDWDTALVQGDKVVKLEARADDLKREVRRNLPRGLFMPVSRSDLLELLHIQDKIPNLAKDIAGLMTGRRMVIPEALAPIMHEYLLQSVQVTTHAVAALEELDELIVSGFSGRETQIIAGMIARLDDAEHDTDLTQIKVRRALFAIEVDLNPVDVMFLYRIIDWIGDISDFSQTVGHRLLLLIAR